MLQFVKTRMQKPTSVQFLKNNKVKILQGDDKNSIVALVTKTGESIIDIESGAQLKVRFGNISLRKNERQFEKLAQIRYGRMTDEFDESELLRITFKIAQIAPVDRKHKHKTIRVYGICKKAILYSETFEEIWDEED